MQLSKTISNALAKKLLCFIFSFTICSFSFRNICNRFRKKNCFSLVKTTNVKRSDRKKLAIFLCLKNRQVSVIFCQCRLRFKKNCRCLPMPINRRIPNEKPRLIAIIFTLKFFQIAVLVYNTTQKMTVALYLRLPVTNFFIYAIWYKKIN